MREPAPPILTCQNPQVSEGRGAHTRRPRSLPEATPRRGRSPLAVLRAVVRWALAALLLVAGVAHFVIAEEFLGQVPQFLPWRLPIVYVSGVVEIGLGLALFLLPRHRRLVGWVVAAFFVAVFPGNIAQYVEGNDSFGLDTDQARLTRLFFQPVLVVLALWSTQAWRRTAHGRREPEAQ